MSLTRLEQAELDWYLASIEALAAERDKHAAEARSLTLEADNLQRKMNWDLTHQRERRVYDFTGDVSDVSIADAVDEIHDWALFSKDPITLRLNSPGGSVFDGLMLYDFLREVRVQHGIMVITHTLGYAASMASVLSQVGDVRRISRNAWFMVHEPASIALGKASALRDEADLLKKLHKQLVGILAERSNLSPTQIARKCERKDWWMTAEEAANHGFFDEVV